MSQDKELIIRLQFLEEAQEYVNTIETALLGLAASGVVPQKVDGMLRASHSIKGGAAMMGFLTLSDLAHRLEDFFKILKIRRPEVDESLEHLLLRGGDCLGQVISRNAQGQDVDSEWLETYVYPLFEQVHLQLGEVPPEETLLPSEDGQDMVALLFESEVEGCLQRLASVIDHPEQPCLHEELTIIAQELSGLGEMLQLHAFTDLCQAIAQELTTHPPDQVGQIAPLALQTWRRAQALVIAGQRDVLPTQLDSPQTPAELTPFPTNLFNLDSLLEPSLDESMLLDVLGAADLPDFALEMESQWNAAADPMEFSTAPIAAISDIAEPEAEMFMGIGVPPAQDRPPAIPPPPLTSLFQPSEVQTSVRNHPAADATAAAMVPEDNTVRIPVRRLDELNDLFGELTIERNALNLHLGRLRNLIGMLSQRVSTLEQSNIRLRTAYDLKAVSIRPATRSVTERASHRLPVTAARGSTLFSTSSSDTADFDLLELDRYSDLHLVSQEVMETIVQVQEVTSDIDISLKDTDQTASDLNRTAKQLQTSLTQARMRPLSDLVGRFPRALRDLCLQYGKSVELKIHGAATLIDRTILEALGDPLMHLLRNAFDHGIEDAAIRRSQGKSEVGFIEIRATYRGNQTLITLSDDGGGINLEKLRARALQFGYTPDVLEAASDQDILDLIFEPGFSTAEQVTPRFRAWGRLRCGANQSQKSAGGNSGQYQARRGNNLHPQCSLHTIRFAGAVGGKQWDAIGLSHGHH
nr:Hpt domain-containing protein [Neosynechococcus sphagnicola]